MLGKPCLSATTIPAVDDLPFSRSFKLYSGLDHVDWIHQSQLGRFQPDLQGVFKAVPMKPPTVPAIKLLVISCVLVYNVSY
jgi:hypothetical protein